MRRKTTQTDNPLIPWSFAANHLACKGVKHAKRALSKRKPTGNEDEIEGELITVKKTHLEKLEAKLSRVEDTLDEIVMFLGNNDRFASSSQLSQSHLFSKTSVV